MNLMGMNTDILCMIHIPKDKLQSIDFIGNIMMDTKIHQHKNRAWPYISFHAHGKISVQVSGNQ